MDERVVGSRHLRPSCIQGLQVGLFLPCQHLLQRLKELIDLLSVLPHQTLAAGLLLLQLLPQLTHLTQGDEEGAVSTTGISFLWNFYINMCSFTLEPPPAPISAQRVWPAVTMESVFL